MGTSKEQGDGWVEVKDTSCQWGLTRGGEVQSGPKSNPYPLQICDQKPILILHCILMLNPRLRFALTCMYCTPLAKKEGKKLLLIVDTNVNKTLKKEGQQ